MKITINVSPDESAALKRLANQIGCSIGDAAKTGLRSWLIKNGFLDSAEADNDNGARDTQGEA
jgi:hypothetical protein